MIEDDLKKMIELCYWFLIQSLLVKLKTRVGTVGYKVEPWLKTTTDDMFIINMNDVLTMSESSDIEMIMMYQDYIRTSNKPKGNNLTIDRKMGRIGNVNDMKEILEKIFKST